MTHSVLICGGGVAAVEAVLALRDLAGDRVDLTFVSPHPDFVLAPLAVGAPFSVSHVPHWPLSEVAYELDAEHIAGALSRVDAMRIVSISLTVPRSATTCWCSRRSAALPGVRPRPDVRGSDPGALYGLLRDLKKAGRRALPSSFRPESVGPCPHTSSPF